MGGNIIMKYMFFSNTHWPQLTASFYSILFETSICQFNSSNFSPIMPDDVREHLTRDQRHSFIQNPSRSFRFPDPWRCFFSSVHLTHVLQGSGQRTGMAIAEPILVLFLRFVFGLLYGWKIQTWPIIRFLTVSHLLIFYLLVFDIIHDAMCLNKISRTSSRNIGPQHQNTTVYFIVHVGYFLSLCSPNLSWVFAAKKQIVFSS